MSRILLVAITICFAAPILAEDSSFYSDVTKKEYMELKEEIRKSEDLVTEKDKGWGQCRDKCSKERDKCFDSGEPGYVCEARYSVCEERCDQNY